jgi:1,4-alpha-glucan branching enzyme
MSDAWKAMAVYTYFAPGIPLLYTGQEVGNNKRLAFFEKDNVMASRDASKTMDFYHQLGELKLSLPEAGISADLNMPVSFDVKNKALISWVRETADADKTKRSRTYIAINMSDKPQKWSKYPEGSVILSSGGSDKSIEPWGYRVIKMTYKSK